MRVFCFSLGKIELMWPNTACICAQRGKFWPWLINNRFNSPISMHVCLYIDIHCIRFLYYSHMVHSCSRNSIFVDTYHIKYTVNILLSPNFRRFSTGACMHKGSKYMQISENERIYRNQQTWRSGENRWYCRQCVKRHLFVSPKWSNRHVARYVVPVSGGSGMEFKVIMWIRLKMRYPNSKFLV